MRTALRFSEWALEFMIVPPVCFVFVLAAISLVWAAQKQRPFKMRLCKPYQWLVLTHVLFFVAAIAVGVIWACPLPNPALNCATRPAQRCLDAVFYGSLVSCGFWIWRMKGFRWYATSMMILTEMLTWGALIVAGMSITGDWL